MNKEIFVRMMTAAEAFSAETERWNDFGIEIYELPIGEIPWEMFNCWQDSNFTSEGKDWISWYLWERKSIFTNEILPCYDEHNNEFYVNNSEDLWKIVEIHQLGYSDCEETCDNKPDIV